MASTVGGNFKNKHIDNMNKLETVFIEIQKNKKSLISTPRLMLEQFGVGRRGWRVIETINNMLKKYDLTTNPDFGGAYVYGEIEILPKPKLGANKTNEETEFPDPIPRLSLLKAANINNIKDGELEVGLISVNRETSLVEATTLMLKHNFSQLPILSGKRDVEGIVSWKSIGIALSLGKNCVTVIDCKEEAVTLNLNEPLFKAVKVILEKEVVQVCQKDKTICGIVTATDIGEQFISLSEPFLLLEQIENHIRKLLDGKLTLEEINSVLDLTTLDKPLTDLSDLTFGQYIRIIENEHNFNKLKLRVDRTILIKMLDETRIIRNEVMHFNPEPMKPKDIETLRQTLNFLHILASTTVSMI